MSDYSKGYYQRTKEKQISRSMTYRNSTPERAAKGEGRDPQVHA